MARIDKRNEDTTFIPKKGKKAVPAYLDYVNEQVDIINEVNPTAGTLVADIISESTSDTGVTIGGVLIKDGTGTPKSVAKFEDDGANAIVTLGEASTPAVIKDGGTVGDGKSDAYFNIKTVKYTIGALGVAGVDYNAATEAGKTQQNFQLGVADIIPELSRVLDVVVVCTTKWQDTGTGDETLGTEVGSASSGAEYLASANIDDVTDINSLAADGLGHIQTTIAASSVWVGLTPATYNWEDIDDGVTDIYVTYIDNYNVS